MRFQPPPPPPPEIKPVEVRYEHTWGLPAQLEQLELSVLLSAYQAGRVVSVGSHQGELRLGFSRCGQAMGLSRTPSRSGGHAGCDLVPARQPGDRTPYPTGGRARHRLSRPLLPPTGPLMGHDLAWCGDGFWLVNTLFNGLVTIEGDWSFVPQWQPSFISDWAAGDRCHLNGLAMAEDGSALAYVTALGETDTENGWREHKATSGCLIQVTSGEVVLRGLSMPHSLRLYQGQLYLLDFGRGALVHVDPLTSEQSTIAALPGFTRGLDCFAGHAFAGLSQIRETTVFGGLPLQDCQQELFCGLAIVDLALGAVHELLWFHSGLEDMVAICVVPTALNQEMNQTDIDSEPHQPTCLGPPVAKG